MTACPFDPDLPADECCGTRLTDCCDGPKADCAVSVCRDSIDPDVIVCANGYGCNVYGDIVAAEADNVAVLDAWTREDDAAAQHG